MDTIQTDNKISLIYNRLYEIGKSINETIEIDELYDMAVNFATNELSFEKAIIFEHDDSNGWFKVVKSKGYDNPIEQKILSIINLLLSGEVLEYLRVNGEPIIHKKQNPKEHVQSLAKSLFLSEAYFELFGGDKDVPHGVIIVGNGLNYTSNYSKLEQDSPFMIALGNFVVQLSNTINNIVFYKAWQEEKEKLEDNILKRTKQIEEQKRMFEAIYKTTKDGIAILDLETTAFLDVNPAYCEMTGFTREELLRTSCLKLSIPEDRETSRQALEEVKKIGYIKNFYKTCIIKSGKRIVVNMSISLMDDKKRILINSKDITKQKELEQELKLINQELENRVQIRTEELNSQKIDLLKLNEDLRNATKVKSEFLANMSHEIRTPLNAILGFVQILKEDEENEEKLKYLTTITNSSKSLLAIINDILDFSKIESGKVEKDNIDFNAIKEFNHIAELFYAICDEKSLSFLVNIDKNIPKYLNADIQKIRQIVSNLLSNAIKFTPKGKNIELHYLWENDNLSICVKDEGIGIPKERQKTIFEAFSQADASTTRKFGGTGLGLSISNVFVQVLGGELQLESKENEGSQFSFTIPCKTSIHIEEKTESPTNRTLEGKILLVEDNIANQKFMQVILKKIGLSYEIANDGVEAIDMFVHNSYSAILMDENMPNMNGIEATQRILEYERKNQLEHTPIIALTANALKGDRERFLEAGMDEYLTKPLNKNKLISILEVLMKK